MMKISTVFGVACVALLAFLAFTTKDNTVLLAMRDFFLFLGMCAGVWVVIGLNSNHPDSLLSKIRNTEEFPSQRHIPYVPHSSQTIIDFIKAGRK